MKYCHHCGKQVIPAAKFCNFCGTSLASLSATPESSQAPQAKANTFKPFNPRADEDDDEMDTREHLDIRINKLEIDLINYAQGGETIGSVASQGAAGIPATIVPRDGAYGNMDNKTFFEQFKKEAGTRGQNDPPTHIG